MDAQLNQIDQKYIDKEQSILYLVTLISQAFPDHTANMSTTTTQTQTTARITIPAKSTALKVDGTDPKYNDWRDDLIRDGFAIVKGAVPRERADKYADAMYTWLESL
jgi:hypothetical protein